MLQPLAGAVYTHLHTGGFIESGGTGFEVAGNAADVDSLRGYVGLRALSTVTVHGTALTPELRARVLQDFLSMRRDLTVSYLGDPTTALLASGIVQRHTAARYGGGLEARPMANWRLAVGYDVEVRGRSVAHLLNGAVRVAW